MEEGVQEIGVPSKIEKSFEYWDRFPLEIQGKVISSLYNHGEKEEDTLRDLASLRLSSSTNKYLVQNSHVINELFDSGSKGKTIPSSSGNAWEDLRKIKGEITIFVYMFGAQIGPPTVFTNRLSDTTDDLYRSIMRKIRKSSASWTRNTELPYCMVIMTLAKEIASGKLYRVEDIDSRVAKEPIVLIRPSKEVTLSDANFYDGIHIIIEHGEFDEIRNASSIKKDLYIKQSELLTHKEAWNNRYRRIRRLELERRKSKRNI